MTERSELVRLASPRYELIDFNAYLGPTPDALVPTSTVEILQRTMASHHISNAVVGSTASALHDPMAGNRALSAAVSSHPNLHPCWVGLPNTCGEYKSADELISEAVAHEVVAFRLYPELHGFALNSVDLQDFYAAMVGASLPLLIDLTQSSWAEIESLATSLPRLPVIVSSIGYRELRQLAGVLERCPNLLIDLANFSSHQGVEWVAARFGVHRIMLGTASPQRDPGEAITRLLWSGLSDAEVLVVGRANAQAMLERQSALLKGLP